MTIVMMRKEADAKEGEVLLRISGNVNAENFFLNLIAEEILWNLPAEEIEEEEGVQIKKM